MRIFIYLAAILLWLFSSITVYGQLDGIPIPQPEASVDTVVKKISPDTTDYRAQMDVVDVFHKLVHNGVANRVDTGDVKSKKLRIAAVPAAGYTLQTDFAAILSANGAFYVNKEANQSTILTSFTYTARNQIILPVQTNIWTVGNKYNIVVDWRYLYFPSYTYGLGGYTKSTDGYIIDYSTIHLHQALLRQLAEDMYAGIGYNMDYYWNIKEVNPPGNKVTDFENYGFSNTEFASGFTFNFLYDTRKNSLNPQKGNFVNVIYRPNLTIFGNTASWRSLVVDLRKYIPFPASSHNVLAFWSYEWLTIDGKAPYLMLPNTGGDPYSNTGRGYIQGRFRGNNMAYIEGEYRFGITNNGLLGGVVFANAQSFTETTSNQFETIAPGWGAGLRLRLNKFSRCSVALDYGFGINGSSGLFVNLGEVF